MDSSEQSDVKIRRHFFARHKFLTILLIIVILTVSLFIARQIYLQHQITLQQDALNSFYTAPQPLPTTAPGTLLRVEPMNVTLPYGAKAYRTLYTTQLSDGSPAISSGMVFVPASPAPVGGRKVVAWAHGTLGFGDQCAPSRSTDPLNDMQNWLDGMMQRGWVVSSTDYTGVGTAGEPYYLIGGSEAHDVINSVRSTRQFTEAAAGSTYAVWGHSQGGNSSLFTAQYASSYAPELHLVAAAAAAPAAELVPLFDQQYNQTVSWAIGPDAAVSWPLVYKNLPLTSVLTSSANSSYYRLAYGCIQQQVGGLVVRGLLNQQFFATNPITNPTWYNAAQEQTPAVSQIKVPIYVAQGLSDTVVLPNTTALLVQKACDANKNITVNWLGNTSHTQVAIVAGPSVAAWLQDRFNGLPAGNSCAQPLPISPASVAAQPK